MTDDKDVTPPPAAKGRRLTVFMLGTLCSRFRAPEPGAFSDGDLVTNLALEYQNNPNLDEYIDHVAVDGVGSGNLDHHLLWVPPTTYSTRYQTNWGYGLDEQIGHIVAVIDGKPTRQDPVIQRRAQNVAARIAERELGPVTEIVAVGWSRGAMNLIRLANALNKTHPQISCYFALIDPVPGLIISTLSEDMYNIPSNVKAARIIYARDERSKFFDTILPKKQDPLQNTEIEIRVLPGHHATIVGNKGLRDWTYVEQQPTIIPTDANTNILKENNFEYKLLKIQNGDKTEEKYIVDFSPSAELCEFWVREFMQQHGSPVTFTRKLTPADIFRLYRHIQMNDHHYAEFAKTTYTMVNPDRNVSVGPVWKLQKDVAEFKPQEHAVNSHHASIVNNINNKMDALLVKQKLKTYTKFIAEKEHSFSERLAAAYYLAKLMSENEACLDTEHSSAAIELLKTTTNNCFDISLQQWLNDTFAPQTCEYYQAHTAYLQRFTSLQQPIETYHSENQELAKSSLHNMHDNTNYVLRIQAYLSEAQNILTEADIANLRSSIVPHLLLLRLHQDIKNYALLCDNLERASQIEEHETLLNAEIKYQPFLTLLEQARESISEELYERLQQTYTVIAQRFNWLRDIVNPETGIIAISCAAKRQQLDEKIRLQIQSTLRDTPLECLTWLERLGALHKFMPKDAEQLPEFSPLAINVLTVVIHDLRDSQTKLLSTQQAVENSSTTTEQNILKSKACLTALQHVLQAIKPLLDATLYTVFAEQITSLEQMFDKKEATINPPQNMRELPTIEDQNIGQQALHILQTNLTAFSNMLSGVGQHGFFLPQLTPPSLPPTPPLQQLATPSNLQGNGLPNKQNMSPTI